LRRRSLPRDGEEGDWSSSSSGDLWVRERLPRLLPEKGGEGDWSCTGRRCASVLDEVLDSLRIGWSKVVREVRRCKMERIGGEGGVRVHRGR
jgi:hypothetical protein